MPTEIYQNVIIGSGEGGKYLAWHLAQSGQKTAVVERRWIGGSCPNVNCLPSKNEIWSAKVANLLYHARSFGSMTTAGPVDMGTVRKRKRQMVEGLVAMHLDRYKATGVELILGQAKLTGDNILDVTLNDGGSRRLQGDRVFLNVGTRASVPPIPGLVESSPLTHIEILELDRLPEHLIVIGGGYVGLEFAQAYRRFGSRVTILHRGTQLLDKADADVAAEIVRMFTAEGIEVMAPAKIVRVHGRSGNGVTIDIESGLGESQISGSDILLATGRIPNTTGIGLESAGIELDQRGYVKVNDRLETTARNVWAIGECAGSPQFTHASLDDFRVVRDNLAGVGRSTRNRIIPSCLFVDPPVAQIGLTENEARRQGIDVHIAKVPVIRVLRTRTIDETNGFMKALIDPNDAKILGFTMIGPEAGEVMAVVQMTMLAGFPYTALSDAILTHPTMAEGLNVLFSSVKLANKDAAKTDEVKSPASPQDRRPSAA
jgi:pyruvate/2-oxoglutarate dehydrogenase complex dihydrolipoamide dehydrogenase (E3) component